MNDYLTMLRNSEVQKFREWESYIIRINVPVALICKAKVMETMSLSATTSCVFQSLCSVFFSQNAINNISKFIEKILTKTGTKDIIIIGRFADCKLV